jgi:hypothetical protein
MAIEQLPGVHEYQDLFPWLTRHLSVSSDGANRKRDWYLSAPIPDAPRPTKRAKVRIGPLCPRGGTGTITTRRLPSCSDIAQVVDTWRQRGRPCVKTLCTTEQLRKMAGVINRYQLQWNGSRYVEPSVEDMLRLQGFGPDFASVFVRAWQIASSEVGTRMPSVRQVIGNGWNCVHGLDALHGVDTPPTAIVELCSGMGPMAFLLHTKFKRPLDELRIVIQAETDPGTRRVSALVLLLLKQQGVLPPDLKLIQLADVWDLVRDNSAVSAQYYGAKADHTCVAKRVTVDLTPAGLHALLASNSCSYDTTVVAAGPPCNGFAGQNFARTWRGRTRLAHPGSYAAFAVSIFTWNMHRHGRGRTLQSHESDYIKHLLVHLRQTRDKLSSCEDLSPEIQAELTRRNWVIDLVESYV